MNRCLGLALWGALVAFCLLSTVCSAELSLSVQRHQRRPVVIAHRGASGYLPEHTLEAKVAAILMGADYVEQDLVLSRDNVPVVLHDIYLDQVTNVAQQYGPSRARSTDGRYYAVDFTYAEIAGLRVSERFRLGKELPHAVYAQRFPVGQSRFALHSLAEEIELVLGLAHSMGATKPAGLYVEIKNPAFHRQNGKANFSEIVLDTLRRYNYTQRHHCVVVQCFDYTELRRIRFELASNLTLVQLLQKTAPAAASATGLATNGVNEDDIGNLPETMAAIAKYADGIGPEKDQLIVWNEQNKTVSTSPMYKNARHHGLFLHPYTFRADALPAYAANYTELLRIFLRDLQVDGLFTDFPDLTVQFLNEKSHISGASPKLSLSRESVTAILMLVWMSFASFNNCAY